MRLFGGAWDERAVRFRAAGLSHPAMVETRGEMSDATSGRTRRLYARLSSARQLGAPRAVILASGWARLAALAQARCWSICRWAATRGRR